MGLKPIYLASTGSLGEAPAEPFKTAQGCGGKTAPPRRGVRNRRFLRSGVSPAMAGHAATSGGGGR